MKLPIPLLVSLLASLILGSAAQAQRPRALNVLDPAVPIAKGQELLYRIDLGTIPARPELHVTVAPTNPDPAVQIQIEVTNWAGLIGPFGVGGCVGGGVWNGGPSFLSPPSSGSAHLEVPLRGCEPRISTGFWENGTVDVLVRVLSFGRAGAPAPFDVSIRGITQVPFAEHAFEVELDTSPQTLLLNPVQDTVLYEGSTLSNGFGEFLWAGQDYSLTLSPPFLLQTWSRRHSLLAFDFVDLMPVNAVVTNADLRLYVYETLGTETLGSANASLYRTAPSPTGAQWAAGSANASGTEFFGATSSFAAANWFARRDPSGEAWATPGGDVVGSALGSLNISGTGFRTFSSPALDGAVQSMVDAQEDRDGFLLKGASGTAFQFDRGVRFASDQDATASRRPQLRIDYTPEGPYSDGTFTTGTVTFIGEGSNFRWIYDTDLDDILVTPIDGVCEITSHEMIEYPRIVPYVYSYLGSPGYVGVDCCAWQIDSTQTGTVGAGQAIFFHNIDPANPANIPPDSDGDGMRDPCDNCVGVPNGPALGSCIGLQGTGAVCQSDLDCGQYEFCSLSQEDGDFDQAGDACSVPEPGLASGLAIGGLGLVWGSVARRKSSPAPR